MSADGSVGLALGGVALVAGAAAIVLDVAPLGGVAGAAGLAAGILLANAVHHRETGEEARADAEAREADARHHLDLAEARVSELELALATPVDTPDTENVLNDPETGMPGEAFFTVSLESRVAAARRHLRPVGVVLLEVANRDGTSAPIGAVATKLIATLRQADTACRLEGGGTKFGLVLEDTPENGAVWTVERFRRALASDGASHVLWAGIACYPAHAFDAEELRRRATEALDAARQWRQDRIEVATASEV